MRYKNICVTSDLWTGLHMAVFDGTVTVVGPERTWSLKVHLQEESQTMKTTRLQACQCPSKQVGLFSIRRKPNPFKFF